MADPPVGYWFAVFEAAVKLINQKWPAEEAYWHARNTMNEVFGIQRPGLFIENEH